MGGPRLATPSRAYCATPLFVLGVAGGNLSSCPHPAYEASCQRLARPESAPGSPCPGPARVRATERRREARAAARPSRARSRRPSAPPRGASATRCRPQTARRRLVDLDRRRDLDLDPSSRAWRQARPSHGSRGRATLSASMPAVLSDRRDIAWDPGYALRIFVPTYAPPCIFVAPICTRSDVTGRSHQEPRAAAPASARLFRLSARHLPARDDDLRGCVRSKDRLRSRAISERAAPRRPTRRPTPTPERAQARLDGPTAPRPKRSAQDTCQASLPGPNDGKADRLLRWCGPAA